MKLNSSILLILAVISSLFCCEPVLARASGSHSSSHSSSHSRSHTSSHSWSSSHSSSSSSYSSSSSSNSFDGGGLCVLLLMGVWFLVLWIKYRLVRLIAGLFGYSKSSRCQERIYRAAQEDKYWKEKFLRTRVRQSFFAVQKAWGERNQNIARKFMTERLFLHHKSLTDAMRLKGEKNIMKKISLHQVDFIDVKRSRDKSKDSFKVKIYAEMIDYVVRENTSNIVKGNKYLCGFEETWYFVRQDNNWVLDKIKA